MGRGRVKEQPIIFDKGLNTSVTDVGTVPHPITMDNVWLSRDDRGGAVEQIPGYSLFHTFADNDVAIQTIGSAGIKKYSFALYGLGSTKFYRYVLTNPPVGNPLTQNIATKTGLTDGADGTILIAGDVDGHPHAWVFNGVDSPFMSDDWWDYTSTTPWDIDDVGVTRPDASDYSTASDRIYIEAGSADIDGAVKHFWMYNYVDGGAGDQYTDDTTDANDAGGSGDVLLGPTIAGAITDWDRNKDGHFVASDTVFGGLRYDIQTAAVGGAYTWKYWNGTGWVDFPSIEDGTVSSSQSLAQDGDVTWTIPTDWQKRNVPPAGASKKGPYFWASCVKKSGDVDTAATADQVEVLNQRVGEEEAQGIVKHFISKIDGTSESALSEVIKQSDGTEGIDAGTGGTVKIVIDKDTPTGDANYTDDPNYYKTATFKLYRTYEDGAQPYDTGIRITTDGDGDGEAEDDVDDSDLGNLPYIHGDPPPDTSKAALSHFGRIFVADAENTAGTGGLKCRVYWSDLANPESFWTEENGSYVEVFKGDGEEITALARDRDGVLVFKNNHLYKINGRTPDEFYLTEITLAHPNASAIGTPSLRSFCYTPSGIVFYWNKGVYLYNGSYPRKISTPIDQDLRGIDSHDEASGVAVGYYSHRNQVYVSVPLSGSNPSHTYIFDMDVGEWAGRMTDGFRQFFSLSVDADTDLSTFDSDTNEMFLGVDWDATGKVYRLDTGTQFESATIDSGLTLSPFFGSSLNRLKTFLYVDVIFEPVAAGIIDLEWWIDGESGDSTTVAIAMDKTGYGRHRRRVNIGYKGRDLTLKINNDSGYGGDWKVYGLIIGYIEHESYSL